MVRIDSMRKKKVSSCCNIIPSPCFCFKRVSSRRDIALKIKAIKEQLDVIDSNRSRFSFAPGRSEKGLQRLITTSAIDISEVRGRDVDQRTILDHLLGCPGKEKSGGGLYIISIVGTGGMGKTTLAQLAFNHRRVKAHFDETIWVCVSDPFEPIRIFRDILEILHQESPNLRNLEALQQKVQTCISGKKFLLVLDDVWTENQQLWDQLSNTLTTGAEGSRVIVTTRKESVVKRVRTTYKHPLGALSREQSRSIFHHIAFLEKSRDEVEGLEEIGEKIVDKCKGLPLAIKILGNHMRLKDSKEEWEGVLNNEVWQLDVFETDISPVLLLSYYDLPTAIKCCFSYCAVFPKDTEIEVNNLIKLWMAQGYLNSNAISNREMETLGREYFNYLAAGSFFQEFEKDDEGNEICKMHDVVHDFAQFLTKNESLNTEVSGDSANEGRSRVDPSFQKRRHATIVLKSSAQNFGSTDKMKNLRTLLLDSWQSTSVIIPETLPNLFQHLTCLRALHLSHNNNLEELPKEVGELIHLRFLNVSKCPNLKYLSETICDLCNLQTLNVSYCRSLEALPRTMDKLINLRHLENGSTLKLKGLPKVIERLKSLQTLEEIVVRDGNGEYCKIEDLRFRGWLVIRGLDKVKNAMEAKRAEMKNKIHLKGLTFEFESNDMKDVAEALEPHPNLNSLYIHAYDGTDWPNWMMRSLLTQLKTLRLRHCRKCSYMPPLGHLPLLEELEITSMDSVESLGDELLGSSSTISFPKLKTLTFGSMKAWERWDVKEKEERSVMPCLAYLRISDCPKLERLPDHLVHSNTPLQLLEISRSDILQKRYQMDGEEDEDKVSHHIPSIIIYEG